MKRILIIFSFPFLFISCDNGTSIDWNKLVDEKMHFASQQNLNLKKSLPDSLMPWTFQDGKLVTSGTNWWCRGFYPGLPEYIK